MKNVKIMSLIMALCMVVVLFSSCGKTNVAMEYEGEKISSNLYSYWLSQIKSNYVTASTDTEAYWSTKDSSGKTYEEKVREFVDYKVKINLVCVKLFDELGLKFSEKDVADLEQSLQDMVDSFNSKNELNKTLSQYNINYNMLKEIYEIELKTTMVFDALYATGGPREISDAVLDKYFTDNYSRLDIIMIYDSVVYVTDKDGNPIWDETTGKYKTKELTAEESKAKNELADEIMKKLDAGEDFDVLKNEYNEDPQRKTIKDGYYVSSNDVSVYGSDIVIASQTLDINEHKKLDDGAIIYIVKRKELMNKPYEDENYSEQLKKLKSYCQTSDFGEFIEEYIDDVKVYEEEISKYSVKDAKLMTY